MKELVQAFFFYNFHTFAVKFFVKQHIKLFEIKHKLMIEKYRNIGILAHVDAGKTTLTENFLFKAGAIRKMGSVDNGSAITDFLEVEKSRGISVRAATTSFIWNNCRINLIDTPGHIDFSGEVERILQTLDGAILLISAFEGIQAHTVAIFNALIDMKLPFIICINKLDRSGADVLTILDELKTEFSILPILMQYPVNQGLTEASIENLWETAEKKIEKFEKDKMSEMFEKNEFLNFAIETLAEIDEEIFELYVEEKNISETLVLSKIEKHKTTDNFVPVFLTIAKNNLGIEEILNGIIDYLPENKANINDPLSALVFKIEHDKTLGRLAHIKMFGGVLKPREAFFNFSQQKDSKVSQIKKIYTQKLEDIKELHAGDIGIISGIPDICVCDIIGNPAPVPKNTSLNIPLLTVQVSAKNESDYSKLASALIELSGEDPSLNFKWLKDERELHINIMGNIQTEVLQTIIFERFSIETIIGKPTIIYKETPIKKAEGFARYWMPKPCWAIIKINIEPAGRGSGICYESKVSFDKIQQKYQNEIERTVPKALEQGIKGWQVTDLKITLTDGEDHVVHSNPGDFIIATPMAIMRALENAGTKLLEPYLKFEISAPEDFLGKIAGELTNMRAKFANPTFNNLKFTLKGTIPAATSVDFPMKLNAITGGKAKLKMLFAEYNDCPTEAGEIRKFKGVCPLDESKWILHARGAFKAGEWKF